MAGRLLRPRKPQSKPKAPRKRDQRAISIAIAENCSKGRHSEVNPGKRARRAIFTAVKVKDTSKSDLAKKNKGRKLTEFQKKDGKAPIKRSTKADRQSNTEAGTVSLFCSLYNNDNVTPLYFALRPNIEHVFVYGWRYLSAHFRCIILVYGIQLDSQPLNQN